MAEVVVGVFALQMLKVYPHLKFVVQDRPESINQGKDEVFPKSAPWALKDGRVTFVDHDFFQRNPVIGADVYWLRRILSSSSSSSRIDATSGSS
ncbi:o-methyltransferase [Colletotrichum chrysophilum]|uniref:O-methyltransferase n=1 Tax=Colletotrichum chrysophilum TaxID=1836956 RepID=A0AAD9E9Z8_9PEZI|nr:o-methyltransferase [Colletotrichum chrysophilum]